MSYLFLILFCSIPFSHFVFNKVDIWHAQGHVFQVGFLILYCWSFFEKPKRLGTKNYPLGVFLLWAGLLTAFYWYTTLVVVKQYAIKLFFPFFNLLTAVIMYKLIVDYLTEKHIERILFGISMAAGVVACYSILQAFDFDQFYVGLGRLPGHVGDDQITGVIGNTTHNAGYLALCLPLFFRKRWYNLVTIPLVIIAIALCRSASGAIATVVVIFFWLFMKKQYVVCALSALLCVWFTYIYNGFVMTFCNFSLRLSFWGLLFEKFKEKAITGTGLGMMNAWKLKLEASTWRHAHQEFYQVAVELGIIGLLILLWLVFDYFRTFRTFRTDLTIRLASVFLVFIVLSMASFPAHLFLLSSIAIVAYSGLYALKGEQCDVSPNEI